jgi:hypothetical protein
MDFARILHSPLFACGLVGLMLGSLAVLAFLKNRRKITDRNGIIIIVGVFLLALLALTVNIE